MENLKLIEVDTLKVIETWYKIAYLSCRKDIEDYKENYIEDMCNLSILAHMKCMLKDLNYSPAEINLLEEQVEGDIKRFKDNN